MPQARSYRRDCLPEHVRQRHGVVDGTSRQVLQALKQHSEPIFNGIRSTIGADLHLSRPALLDNVSEELNKAQVVLVSGPAGGGKSSLAKEVAKYFAKDYFVFYFRASEFARAHFDDTLSRGQIPVRGAQLGTVLAGQPRKLLVIESMERLLEASTRDAFTDLMTLVSQDESWVLLISCRDYSTDLVRSAFLDTARLQCSVVTVPALNESELFAVENSYPNLARPLESAPLRRLLSNPYVLDLALRVEWSEPRPLPQSEREFRNYFWQDIVRVDRVRDRGLPQRRENVTIEVALKRARALSAYVSWGNLDAEVIDSLDADSLLVHHPQNPSLIAPAHDVLEDWALLRWLDDQYSAHGEAPADFAAVLGSYPAIRRAYRKWLGELVECNDEVSDRLLQAALPELSGLPPFFRDDTLVALLRSSKCAELLGRNEQALFGSGAELWRRVVHLLRVACVTAPDWMDTTVEHGSGIRVPSGPGWPSVLGLVRKHLDTFGEDDRFLILGLLKDWARGVNWRAPYPEGSDTAVAIAHWLLPHFNDYRSDAQRKAVLEVIAQIPRADPDRFAALLDKESEPRSRSREALADILLTDLTGTAASRDLPDLVVEFANDYLLAQDREAEDDWLGGGSMQLEPVFGISEVASFKYFPASAYRGPFLPLLRFHPAKGLSFIISLLNHGAAHYADPQGQQPRLELPIEITLTFEGGATRTQWCNGRLWNFYRGTSVGPYVLQSALMALETWLLEVGESDPTQLDNLLLHILRESNNVALTAVVASVSTAFPLACTEALLVLLSSWECIVMDRHRMGSDQAYPRIGGGVTTGDRFYYGERKVAQARPHRTLDLEMAIFRLQWGPNAARVHKVIDQYRQQLPPLEEQDERDKLWRLALHRMDARHFTVERVDAATLPISASEGAPSEGNQVFLFTGGPPEADLQQMIEAEAPRRNAVAAGLSLALWGNKVFEREENSEYDPALWRARLQEAQAATVDASPPVGSNLAEGGPTYVAAVCVRDHWNELNALEREWCIDVCCSEVERESDNWNHLARVQRFSMYGDRPAAVALSMLLGKDFDQALRPRVLRALVLALTHPADEVCSYAVAGVGTYLWPTDSELGLRSINALALQAILLEEAAAEQRSRPFDEREVENVIPARCAAAVRDAFTVDNGIVADAYLRVNPSTPYGSIAFKHIVTILSQSPDDHRAVLVFEKLASTLVEWWHKEDEGRRVRHRPGQPRFQKSFETEAAYIEQLAIFALHTRRADALTVLGPIIRAVGPHSDGAGAVLKAICEAEDRQPNTDQFWEIWQEFADAVRLTDWLAHLDSRHSHGQKMIGALFLALYWNEGVRTWKSLGRQVDRLHDLFAVLPVSSTVVDNYVRFLYDIGEQSLPHAFTLLASRIRQRRVEELLADENTVFRLEVLLQRNVYGRPLELKRETGLREAVLFLLDALVERGSSAAFRMRDDFVTPLPPG